MIKNQGMYYYTTLIAFILLPNISMHHELTVIIFMRKDIDIIR